MVGDPGDSDPSASEAAPIVLPCLDQSISNVCDIPTPSTGKHKVNLEVLNSTDC